VDTWFYVFGSILFTIGSVLFVQDARYQRRLLFAQAQLTVSTTLTQSSATTIANNHNDGIPSNGMMGSPTNDAPLLPHHRRNDINSNSGIAIGLMNAVASVGAGSHNNSRASSYTATPTSALTNASGSTYGSNSHLNDAARSSSISIGIGGSKKQDSMDASLYHKSNGLIRIRPSVTTLLPGEANAISSVASSLSTSVSLP
jgi:hypothetical protein